MAQHYNHAPTWILPSIDTKWPAMPIEVTDCICQCQTQDHIPSYLTKDFQTFIQTQVCYAIKLLHSFIGSVCLMFPQRICPDWKDVKSIVALLRQCNYNVEDCVNMYLLLNDDGKLPCRVQPCFSVLYLITKVCWILVNQLEEAY